MDQKSSPQLTRLSRRQRQCLELVGKGYSSKQIGRQLNLSPSTVDNHIRDALQRLGLSSRATAAQIFAENHQINVAKAQTAESHDDGKQSRFRLPPVGGRVNNLSTRRRVWHVVQIALMGIMGMTAAVITIAGLVNLFSAR
jgi:DNA-binding CsgD family transcriptional regulator